MIKARVWLVVFLAGVMVFGCAGISKTMAAQVGRPIAEVIDEWGPPAQVVPDGRGGMIYTWGTVRNFSTPGYAHFGRGSAVYVPPTSSSYVATRSLWVDQNGIVYRWRWKGL